MIRVTKLNGEEMFINAELIESVQSRPDTLITLTNGNRIMVQNSVNEIIEKVKIYKKEISRAVTEFSFIEEEIE